MAPKDFPHLPLVLRREGRYRHPKNQFPQPTDQELENRRDRKNHASQLGSSIKELRDAWAQRDLERSSDLPTLPAGRPLMLEEWRRNFMMCRKAQVTIDFDTSFHDRSTTSGATSQTMKTSGLTPELHARLVKNLASRISEARKLMMNTVSEFDS